MVEQPVEDIEDAAADFKEGDKVKVHGKHNGTVVGQDGDTYYVKVDGHSGSQAVSADALSKSEEVGFKQGSKVMYKGQPVIYIRPYTNDPEQSYVKMPNGSDELVPTAELATESSSDGNEKLNTRELAEFIQSFYDKDSGTFPKGPEGVCTMVGKKFGEQAEQVARRFVERMAPQQATDNNPELQELARIRELSGM
jgi:hypothetical protein